MNSFAKEPFIPFWNIRVVRTSIHIDSSRVPGPHDPAPEAQRPRTLRTLLTLPSPAGRSRAPHAPPPPRTPGAVATGRPSPSVTQQRVAHSQVPYGVAFDADEV